MPQIFISPWIEDFMKSHAQSSPQEIYGWLIGFEGLRHDIYILTAISCERYETQHATGAAPSPLEIQEIDSSIASGLGIIGMYHSHPAEVFHSSTDDRTLQSLSRYYANMVSGVTNGEINKWYQLDPTKQSSRQVNVVVQKKIDQNIRYLAIHANLSFEIDVNSKDPLIPQISTKLIEEFNSNMQSAKFSIFKKSELVRMITEERAMPDYAIKEIISNESEFFLDISFVKNDEVFIADVYSNNDYHLSTNININKRINPSALCVKGSIPLIGILLLNKMRDYPTVNAFKEQIRQELFDEMLFKISRSILKYQCAQTLEIVTPNTILLAYPHTILKMKAWLGKINTEPLYYQNEIIANSDKIDDIGLDQLPSIEKFAENDINFLYSMYKRILALTRSGKKEYGLSLLDAIAKIHLLRDDMKKYESIKNIMSIIIKL